MKLNKTLIVLLAIFMLTISAGAAFADDTATTGDDNNEEDVNQDPIDEDAEDDGDETDIDENETEGDEEMEGEIAPVDDANDGEMLTSSTYEEPVNTTDGANASGSASGEASSSSNLAKNATANPIVILLAAIAGVGLTSIRIRK